MHFVEFLLNSIPLLIQFYAQKYLQDDFAKTLIELESDSNLPIPRSFDFIVVGAGSAGCVVAARLSEKYSVLLLEAGGTPPPAVDVPHFVRSVQNDPSLHYFFKSVAQENVSQSTGGIMSGSLGKMMGGSGSHNELIHSRGSPHDFDNWAKLTNDPSWSYANVLKYFKRMEHFVGPKFGNESDEFYGKDGPLTISTRIVPLLPLWFEAGEELGFPRGDPNGFQTESFTPFNLAISGGRRVSSYTGYIRPIENSRARLTVIKYANVSEILLNENKEAYGVAYTRHGIPQIAHAGKEVILSAGAFASPLLLMKSGIGPRETLSAANIPVRVDLESVGSNLGEHPIHTLGPFYVNDSSMFFKIDPTLTEHYVKEFEERGQGPLSKISESVQAFISSSSAQVGWPDLWIHVHPLVQIIASQDEQLEEPQIINMIVILGRPKSTGSVLLNATAYRSGVRDDPQLALVDYKHLSDPADVEAMIEGIKFAFKIAENTTAFRKLNMTFAGIPDPACSAHIFRSDDYWKCYLRQHTSSATHIVGTCRMGPDSEDSKSSVVDTKFRVRGVKNLRIVDGSVIPIITNANVNAPILMIAEKASEEILDFWSSLDNLNLKSKQRSSWSANSKDYTQRGREEYLFKIIVERDAEAFEDFVVTMLKGWMTQVKDNVEHLSHPAFKSSSLSF